MSDISQIKIGETTYDIKDNVARQGGGTTNYNQLSNKPKINNVELSGNKTASQLGLQDKEFVGTHAEWNALTVEQKALYEIVNFTDDSAASEVVDSVPTRNSTHLVQSGGVFDALSEINSNMAFGEWASVSNSLNLTIKYRRNSYFVEMIVTNGTTVISSETLVADIPTGCRPTTIIYGAGTNNCSLRIDAQNNTLSVTAPTQYSRLYILYAI